MPMHLSISSIMLPLFPCVCVCVGMDDERTNVCRCAKVCALGIVIAHWIKHGSLPTYLCLRCACVCGTNRKICRCDGSGNLCAFLWPGKYVRHSLQFIRKKKFIELISDLLKCRIRGTKKRRGLLKISFNRKISHLSSRIGLPPAWHTVETKTSNLILKPNESSFMHALNWCFRPTRLWRGTRHDDYYDYYYYW